MKVARFDPRIKLFLLLICVFCTMFAPSLCYELVLVCLIAIISIWSGKFKYALKSTIFYVGIYLITQISIAKLDGATQVIFMAFLGLVNKVYPCGVMAGIMIKTTKVGEFMAAFYKMHFPNQFVIPFAVMMRYLPVVREDWSHIKDAMRLRGISMTANNILLHPMVLVECLYVPLMMVASNTADELSIAAVTRGIENPKPRTSIAEIKLTMKDFFVLVIFGVYFIVGLMKLL